MPSGSRAFRVQVPSQLVVPSFIQGNSLHLEGEELKVIALGHTDTSNTTALHVPSIDLVVSGDAVYNNTHPYLAECDEKARGEWLRALDKIEALHPNAVIAGHGVLSSAYRGNEKLYQWLQRCRSEYLNCYRAVRENTGTTSKSCESMFPLGKRQGSERKYKSSRLGGAYAHSRK